MRKLLFWSLAFCLTIGLSPAAGPLASGQEKPLAPEGQSKADEPAANKNNDRERIVGDWRVAKMKASGVDLTATVFRVTFTKDGECLISVFDEFVAGNSAAEQFNPKFRYRLVWPGEIEFPALAGVPKKRGIGIYKFEGDDRLTIYTSGDDKLPTGGDGEAALYTAERGSGGSLWVLNRTKPGEKPTPAELAKFKDTIPRSTSANNLKRIGVAMHEYNDVHKNFPAHAIYGKDGETPLLSWRVAILPYLGQKALYDEFKLDEPWDSTHNKKLIAKMPKVYEAPLADKKKDGQTYYQVFTGPDTPFNGPKQTKVPQDITDGTSNTLLMIEATNPVVWTKPADLTLPKDKGKLPAVGGFFKKGMNILFFDGSVLFANRDVSPTLLRALVTPSGGESLEGFEWETVALPPVGEARSSSSPPSEPKSPPKKD